MPPVGSETEKVRKHVSDEGVEHTRVWRMFLLCANVIVLDFWHGERPREAEKSAIMLVLTRVSNDLERL